MAGPSIGTWVKVRNKSGRMTSRVIPNKFGGGGYSKGEVITQSEFKKVQERRAESGTKPKQESSKGKGIVLPTKEFDGRPVGSFIVQDKDGKVVMEMFNTPKNRKQLKKLKPEFQVTTAGRYLAGLNKRK